MFFFGVCDLVGTADLQKHRLTCFETGFDCKDFPPLTKYIAEASASAGDSSSKSAKLGSGGIGAPDQIKTGGKGRMIEAVGSGGRDEFLGGDKGVLGFLGCGHGH